jgi:hypothetical protein
MEIFFSFASFSLLLFGAHWVGNPLSSRILVLSNFKGSPYQKKWFSSLLLERRFVSFGPGSPFPPAVYAQHHWWWAKRWVQRWITKIRNLNNRCPGHKFTTCTNFQSNRSAGYYLYSCRVRAGCCKC